LYYNSNYFGGHCMNLRLKNKSSLDLPSIYKRIGGIIAIISGFGFLGYGYGNNIIYFMNIGIGMILVGWIVIIFSYEKYLKYDIALGIFNDYADVIIKLIKSLDINTSGIIIPPKENLKIGCIFLPLNANFKINFGLLDDNVLFINSDNKKEMGVVFPPLGKGFIDVLSKYDDIVDLGLLDMNNPESKIILKDYLNYSLNLFQMGNNVSINFEENSIVEVSYKISDNGICKKLQSEDLCRKCPCPVCGFIVLSIAKSLNKILQIDKINETDNKITIRLLVVG